jgi:hypothetical protein
MTGEDKLYYKTLSKEVFTEVKEAAIKIWRTYDNTFGYASAKIDRIKDLPNVRDNVMYIVAMFDHNNQVLLASMLSDNARKQIWLRMEDSVAGNYFNPFRPI